MEKKNTLKKRVFFIAKRDKAIFDFLKEGKKTVETRAATVRNLYAKAGDTALFICERKCIEKKIKKVTQFKTIDGLLKTYPVSSINPAVKTKKELIEMYEHFPGYKEKIARFGILAFELD